MIAFCVGLFAGWPEVIQKLSSIARVSIFMEKVELVSVRGRVGTELVLNIDGKSVLFRLGRGPWLRRDKIFARSLKRYLESHNISGFVQQELI